MSYFLRKIKKNKGTYLQIIEGHRDPHTQAVVQTTYKTLGYAEELKSNGIEDPIAYYSAEVEELNLKLKLDRETNRNNLRLIGDVSPLRYAGYFPVKKILDTLGVEPYIRLFNEVTGFRYDIYELLSALVFARIVAPCSKKATFHDVLPNLVNGTDASYDQILSCCEFVGSNYEKMIEIFTAMVQKKYGTETSHTYFDCTNFFFEIDKEDELRRNGPSKENRKCPIVGMGLLLDSNMIPIGMKMFPGNESEKPVLRNIIGDLKEKNQIKGKTVHVADKGLNCADNIVAALKDKDGYIFSKSVKMLSEVEKTWVKLEQDWVDVLDDVGQVKYRYKECIDSFPYIVKDENGKPVTIHLKEKRVLTFNPRLAEKQKYEINRMVEKARGLCYSKAKRSEFGDTGKFIDFTAKNKQDETVVAKINEDAVATALSYCGYNLLVTSELNMSASEVYGVYHNLWRIEESFRVMKTDLDARPVFLQKKNSIYGHFLICYISVLLIRLLQFKVLDNRFGTPEIVKFMRDFKVALSDDNTLINLTAKGKMVDVFSEAFSVNLNLYFLKSKHLKAMGLM
jgi:Transposase